MIPPETQKRIFLLERENERLRIENEELKARINRMVAKYKALQEQDNLQETYSAPQNQEDPVEWLLNKLGMKD